MSRHSNGLAPQYGRRSYQEETSPRYREELKYFKGLESNRPAGVASHPDSDGKPLPVYPDESFVSPRSQKKVDPALLSRPAGVYHEAEKGGPILKYMEDAYKGPRPYLKADPSQSSRPAGITYHPDGKGNPLKWLYDEDGRRMITPMPASGGQGNAYTNGDVLASPPRPAPPIYERPKQDSIRIKDIKSIDLLVTLNDNTKVVISNAAFKPL